MTKEEKDTSPYWICDSCAKQKNLVTRYPHGGNTICQMECGYCKDDNGWVTPIVDFKRPGKPDSPWD